MTNPRRLGFPKLLEGVDAIGGGCVEQRGRAEAIELGQRHQRRQRPLVVPGGALSVREAQRHEEHTALATL